MRQNELVKKLALKMNVSEVEASGYLEEILASVLEMLNEEGVTIFNSENNTVINNACNN